MAQDYGEIEVVIKDGGSSDGTVEWIKSYKESSNFPINLISSKDTGIYDAMNQGYEQSTGDIIAFINDFIIADDVVSKMVEVLQINPSCQGAHADLVYTDADKIKRFWKMGEGRIEEGWMPAHPTLFLNREVYENYGLYDTSYICSADYEFMIRILCNHQIKLAYYPHIIIKMFYGGTSTNGLNGYMLSLKEAHRALRNNHINKPFLIDILRTIKVYKQFQLAKKIV